MYFVGCSMGRSLGFAPFRIRSTKKAVRAASSLKSTKYARTAPPAAKKAPPSVIVGRRRCWINRVILGAISGSPWITPLDKQRIEWGARSGGERSLKVAAFPAGLPEPHFDVERFRRLAKSVGRRGHLLFQVGGR